MTLEELKAHVAHYETYGSTVPLPREVMEHLFEIAHKVKSEAEGVVAEVVEAVKSKRAKKGEDNA